MTPHPTPETLERYVIGAHDEVAVADVEAHLRACDACTDEVQRQARVDLAMAEVAAAATFCPGCDAVLLAPRCPHCGAVAEVGGFRVEKVLVENDHSRMYLARDAAGKAVALKELAFVKAPHPDAVLAFEREGRLLQQLDHPRIPRFLASFRDGDGVSTRLYLAQEYVEGESLAAWMQRRQVSEAEAVDVAHQVLEILRYLQALSPMVFHRDVKPANLIRSADGRISLVDFGAARDLGPTVGATLVGTFGYMPLEQMGGIVDATTDLYALGATLAHLLSRREPWKLFEDPQALQRLNVSEGFRAFVAKLMARQPSERFPSAAAADEALAHPPAPRRHRRPWHGGGLRGRVALLSMAFVAAGGVALGFRLSRPVKERRLAPRVVAPGRLADGTRLRRFPVKIDSVPAGADVHVVGSERRLGTTPFVYTFEYREDEPIVLEFRMKGYEPVRREVSQYLGLVALKASDPRRRGEARILDNLRHLQVDGALKPSVVREHLSDQRGALQACYDDALARSPSLEASVQIQILVSPEGAVVGAIRQQPEVRQSPGIHDLDDGLRDCIARVMSSSAFPPATASTVIRFTVRFARYGLKRPVTR